MDDLTDYTFTDDAGTVYTVLGPCPWPGYHYVHVANENREYQSVRVSAQLRQRRKSA